MQKTILTILLVFLFTTSLIAQTQQSVELAPTDTRIANVPYIPDGDVRHVTDIYLPNDNGNHPVIFMVHGGGYVFGDKFSVSFTARYFVEQGYAVIAPNYRLAPAHPYPTPLQDIACAFAWTYTHSDQYNLDMARVIVMGESAGANAVAMLASVDDRDFLLKNCPYSEFPEIDGVVSYYAPADLSSCECAEAKWFAMNYLGLDGDFETLMASEENLRDQWEQASPYIWLDGSEPPFLLIHGTADSLVDFSESEAFVDRLTQYNIENNFIAVENADHGFFARPTDDDMRQTLEPVLEFMSRFFNS